ncbi:hypothetical protein EAI_06365 [Harpegnathos saltator]|uniref:Uncharacterized protein n=1 Tax=Harpegnathos saltator TaxID=610380 RepID=E2BGH9_HARSA|nr:hypothetical protein EAI_06365 [Harpegnathos saltator]
MKRRAKGTIDELHFRKDARLTNSEDELEGYEAKEEEKEEDRQELIHGITRNTYQQSISNRSINWTSIPAPPIAFVTYMKYTMRGILLDKILLLENSEIVAQHLRKYIHLICRWIFNLASRFVGSRHEDLDDMHWPRANRCLLYFR